MLEVCTVADNYIICSQNNRKGCCIFVEFLFPLGVCLVYLHRRLALGLVFICVGLDDHWAIFFRPPRSSKANPIVFDGMLGLWLWRPARLSLRFLRLGLFASLNVFGFQSRESHNRPPEFGTFLLCSMVYANGDLGRIARWDFSDKLYLRLTSGANFLYSESQLWRTLRGQTTKKGLTFPCSRK